MEGQRVSGSETNATSDEEYRNLAAENVIFPPQLRFTEHSLYMKIFCCFVLFLVAVVGNLTILVNLSRRSRQNSAVSLMMAHLASADLLVTVFMTPLEGGLRLAVQWLEGNLACKIFLFLRAFALYLSNNVLVSVSLDRYFAILHPLKNYDARRRGKMMLCVAWFCSFFSALPQLFIFHISPHPEDTTLPKCITFIKPVGAITYNAVCLVLMYAAPLLILFFTQITILREIEDQIYASAQDAGESEMEDGKKTTLRKSTMGSMKQAKRKTLRMTAAMLLIFTTCWGPYIVAFFWSILNGEIFGRMQPWHFDTLFFVAALPPCLNPSLYTRREIN